MTEDRAQREEPRSPGPWPAGGEVPAPPVTPPEQDEEGGDPVCWAHLVCDECGAITTEGHRAGCSRAPVR